MLGAVGGPKCKRPLVLLVGMVGRGHFRRCDNMVGPKSLMQRQRYKTGPHIDRILLGPR
jgi:hypothetical protein